ncbi:MAG TPA: hypothetical protein VKC15_21455 [Gemmatimonadales bacterium]|nr:hypothetical protein [Gemmatimonadales bacterium]
MPKRKQPPKKPAQTKQKADLVRPSDSAVESQSPAALSRFIEVVRKAVNAALDLADAAADAVRKSLHPRR